MSPSRSHTDTHADKIRKALLASMPNGSDRSDALNAVRDWEADLQRLEEALRNMRTLAAVADGGDPWYAEEEGLDSAAIFAEARVALREEKPQP